MDIRLGMFMVATRQGGHVLAHTLTITTATMLEIQDIQVEPGNAQKFESNTYLLLLLLFLPL